MTQNGSHWAVFACQKKYFLLQILRNFGRLATVVDLGDTGTPFYYASPCSGTGTYGI
jgi:hypothetical protein